MSISSILWIAQKNWGNNSFSIWKARVQFREKLLMSCLIQLFFLLLSAAHRSLVPQPGRNCPLQRKHEVFTTGLPGESWYISFLSRFLLLLKVNDDNQHWLIYQLNLWIGRQFTSVQFSHSVASDSLQPHGLQHARLPCLSPTPGACSNSWPLSRWCLPTILSLSSPSPAFNLSQHQGLFQWVSSLHQVAKVLELQHQFFQWIFRIDFRIDWLDLLAVQGTLKSLLQHHSSKASVLQHSAFFMVQLSHPYMIIGKTIALTRWTFVGKVMFLLFNMLCRLVIAFLPRSKCLLIPWLLLPSAVILESKKVKSLTIHCFHIYFPWSDGTGCHDLRFLNVAF